LQFSPNKQALTIIFMIDYTSMIFSIPNIPSLVLQYSFFHIQLIYLAAQMQHPVQSPDNMK